MKVIIVDADKAFACRVAETVRAGGREAVVFHSPEEARKGLAGVEEPFVVLLEHDFGPGERGYDLCRWLRESHTFGLVLPVIYLTANETPEGFLARQVIDPFRHPSAFVAKSELAADLSLLPRLLAEYQRQFEQVRELCDIQLVRQAVYGLATVPYSEGLIDAP